MAPAPESTDDVRYDIALTRQEMTVTLEELSREVAARKAAVRERTVGRVEDFVHEHPLVTAAIALGAGVLLAGTGADEKAAKGVVKGAKAAPGALAGAVKAVPGAAMSLAGKVRDRVSGDGAKDDHASSLGEPTVTHARSADSGASSGGIGDRISGGVSTLLRKALAPVLDEMERAARDVCAELARGSRSPLLGVQAASSSGRAASSMGSNAAANVSEPPAQRAPFDAGADVPRDGASVYGATVVPAAPVVSGPSVPLARSHGPLA